MNPRALKTILDSLRGRKLLPSPYIYALTYETLLVALQ